MFLPNAETRYNTDIMLRSLVTVMVLLQLCCDEVNANYYVEKDQGLRNQALDVEHIFLSSLQTTGAAGCFAQCLTRCRCMTFQVCNETQCQLLSSNRFITPSALRSKLGCTYYDMLKKKTPQNTVAQCKHEIDCCRMSNPCLNGGACTATFATANTTRFKCSCREDFHGNRCQLHGAPMSCRGYSSTQNVPSGIYEIRNSSIDTFKAFCDFDHNTSMAWTLIQSYQLQRQPDISKTLLIDRPVRQDTPSWDVYRLSLSRMKSIRQDSTKWRMTCNFETEGLIYQDYVFGSIADVDILSFTAWDCVKVEYINIRGQSCKNCTIRARQFTKHKSFHFDTIHQTGPTCEFYPTGVVMCENNTKSEDNFGHYHCVNPAHRCTAANTSTTQTWFGREFKVPGSL